MTTSPHGRFAIVGIHEVSIDDLTTEERALAATYGAVRRAEMIAGRAAMRRVLPTAGAILPDDRGAPILPAGWVGSISHKGTRAAALAAVDDGARVGLDLELAAPPRIDVGRRVLTAAEREALRHLGADDYGKAVTLRFSIKEAIYKAIDPMLRRYVGFAEVELDVGAADVGVRTAIPLAIEAWWCEIDGHWLATARARRS